jgi:Rps23 Pro-64 3,4-dihydroxylase Tpa1-like proline 4-hydroxylase
MTPKQILDSFSQTLLQDERILSGHERTLLFTILQHANGASGANQETQEAVRKLIASSVGEIVVQRAFSVLGGSIVDRILQGSASVPLVDAMRPATEYLGPKDPQPPHPTPIVPQPSPTSTPSTPAPSPAQPLVDPRSPGPQPPHATTKTVVSQGSVALAEQREILPARCVVLDEFLAPQELEKLTQFTLDHEANFQASEVVSPHSEGGVVNHEHRSSRVLMDVGKQQDLIVNRIKSVLPQVLEKLGMEEFAITDVEVQITASNDGDFFHFHSDNGSDPVASRSLTFVYFFHREPRGFEGGELRIHDARLDHGSYVSDGTYQTIVPQQNQIVFFACELLHEVTAVKCASKLFGDSRFTLNGWLRH